MPRAKSTPSTLALALAVLLAWLLLPSCQKLGRFTVELDRAELQARVEQLFPVTSNQIVAKITLDDPRLALPEGGARILVDLGLHVDMPLLPRQSGRITLSGRPDYRPGEKAFYFAEPRVETLSVAQLPASGVAGLRGPVEVVARKVLAEHPVYELHGRDLKEAAAAHALRRVRVHDGKLELTLEAL